MRKRINIQFILVVALAIIAIAVSSIVLFYETFKSEILADLKNYTYLLEESENLDGILSSLHTEGNSEFRITMINADGTVAYDTSANTEDMSNHSDRPEITEAFANGEGEAIRQSDTLGMNTFYYAVLLDDGRVLRVSRQAGSVWSIFLTAIPLIALLMVVIFAICLLLNHFLTKSLIKPIEDVANNLDHLENVTVYKEMEPFVSTIKEQHDSILKNARMRQEFTANVSHELKTPLTSISGYAELIENGMASGEDASRFAGEIHANAARLLTLINDILRLSELDSGNFEADMEDVNLYEEARHCLDMLELHASEHEITLHLEGADCTVYSNKNMINEILYNLCDNAIRYNRPGGNVWVRIDADDKNRPFLEVKDDGIGISEKDQQRIFERFYRVDKSRSKKTGGTGLGLAIVKHIVEQQHAILEVESEVGTGTLMRVTFTE